MIVIIWLTFSAVTDTVITIALVWHLVRPSLIIPCNGTHAEIQRRHKTGFPATDDAVDKIMRRQSIYVFSSEIDR